MKFNTEKPYNDLTLIPPAIELETKEILKQALKSHKILAELKGFAEMLPEKNIIINSGGFSETSPEGEAIEKDFLARAKKYGIRIFGPNIL